MSPEFPNRVSEALALIRTKTSFSPDIALVAGTGLAPFLDDIKVETRIPYADIIHFPVSTAPSHHGELLFGTLHGCKVVAQSGRFHLFEGWQAEQIILPVYVLRSLGARTYIATNAAGGLTAELGVGQAVLISDHLNFTGAHPLAGPNDEALGPRFPDMSDIYSRELRRAALEAAASIDCALPQGIYAAVHGPEFETSAERRFLRLAGGDLVGMSTVLEVVAAVHSGMNVLGFSAVTNNATGGPDQQPDTLEEVLANAGDGADRIRRILTEMIRQGVFSGE